MLVFVLIIRLAGPNGSAIVIDNYATQADCETAASLAAEHIYDLNGYVFVSGAFCLPHMINKPSGG